MLLSSLSPLPLDNNSASQTRYVFEQRTELLGPRSLPLPSPDRLGRLLSRRQLCLLWTPST